MSSFKALNASVKPYFVCDNTGRNQACLIIGARTLTVDSIEFVITGGRSAMIHSFQFFGGGKRFFSYFTVFDFSFRHLDEAGMTTVPVKKWERNLVE